MKAKRFIRISLIVLVGVVVLCGSVIGGFLIKSSMEIKALSKLKVEDSPTAKYIDQMPENDEIFGWVEDLTEMGVRQPGTKAHQKAVDYVKTKFENFNLENVHTESADTVRWTANKWGLTVGGVKIDSYYMTHSFNTGITGSFSTPDDGLNSEIVYVGEGGESDFNNINVKGKIVVADVKMGSVPIGLAKAAGYLFYDPNKTLSLFSSRIDPYSANTYPDNYYNALDHGAIAFIGILSNYIESNQYNNEDYSYLNGPMKIPGLWISKSAGKQVKELISKGSTNASMTLVGELETTQGSAVVAYLPGKSDETILVHSHHDSSTTGAVEDASGTSVVLALAKFYSQIPQEDREKTIMFATMDTHFTGYEVHDAFKGNHLQGPDNILADVCVEHIANELTEDADGNLELTGQIEPRVVFISEVDALVNITKEEIVRHRLDRSVILPATLLGDEIPTDADIFYHAGIPIISLVSGPIYLYDNMDTIDMVAKDELRSTAETFADIIWRLCGLPAENSSHSI
ncbi:M28 family peptidase [Paenibacillus peoriae]|uniref:M28 family peptidase n=1 Tax=Paenibacillus peoriae TaxID=59893 RepID=UPI00031D5DC3|nr:M28 family peptidase [Paenibacillus peoriae]MEC0184697.1 M28 family peptidase [Paenibacillus peoriae]